MADLQLVPKSLMDEVLALNFTPAEEVQAEDVKPGEWYIWDSKGFGVTPKAPLYIHATQPGRRDIQGFIRSERDKRRSLGYTTTALQDYVQAAERFQNSTIPTASKDALYCRFYRAKEQPKLPNEAWLTSLATSLSITPTPYTGTDPEIFVEDAQRQVVPAFQFLPGKNAGSSVFWDGFQAEFTVTAGGCQDGVALGIRGQLRHLKDLLPQGCRLSSKSVVEIPTRMLQDAKTEHVEFGCRPSLNAYGLTGEVIRDPRELGIRFAGGHIHWGMRKSNYVDFDAKAVEGIKAMDATVGLMSVSLAEGLDDPRRRRYYGLAGEYRLPAHGVEWRTLSNYWLISPALYHLTFTLARDAFKIGFGGLRDRFIHIPEQAVVAAINSSDAKLARELLEAQKPLWEYLISGHWPFAITWDRIMRPLTTWEINLDNPLRNWETRGWSTKDPSDVSSFPERWSTYTKIHQTEFEESRRKLDAGGAVGKA